MRVEEWLMGATGMRQANGGEQLFIIQDNKDVVLIIAKVIYYIRLAADTSEIEVLITEMSKEFKVGNTATGGAFKFIGYDLDTGTKTIEIYMSDYLGKSRPPQRSNPYAGNFK